MYRGADLEDERAREPTSDVASACGPVLVVQSFGARTTSVRMEVRLRGITREWQPEPLHHRLQRRSLEADPGRSFPGASDHPARFFENPRDVCPLDAVVNSAVDASGRAFCPELSRPSTHAARADGVRSGSAASSSRRMIEDIVALNRNARCPPRATSTFLRCAPWCVSNRHEEGGQKGSCRE